MVWSNEVDGQRFAFPDTLVGTDSLATLRKERADEFMFDENFDPSTLDGFGLKWTYHRDRF